MLNKRQLILTMVVGLLFLTICLLYAQQIIKPAGVYVEETRDTSGTLTFTVRTVTYNGGYAPHNVGAIWITNSTNQFVKTVKIWAQEHRDDLVRWLANSGNNTVGAVTSATISNHQLHTVTWNGTNVSGAQVADGDYKINVEFAEHEASSSNMGKYSVHIFTKGPADIDQTIPNETYFQNLHLTWAPVVQNGIISGTVTNSQNNPISGVVVTAGTQTATTNASGTYSISLPPGTYNVTCTTTSYTAQTQSNVAVVSNQTTTVNFNMGNQLTGTITGTVTNTQTNPIEGAVVTAGAQTATTNANGIYSFTITVGSYNMTCSATNYQTHNQNNVNVTANQTTTVNFDLGNPAMGTLSGIVTNSLSAPISGATVSIGSLSATTDASGLYSISLLPGTFSVNCSASNYETQHQSNVIIESNQVTTLNFMLNSTSVNDDEIVSAFTQLGQNYPNPFNRITSIRFYLDKSSFAELKIYDIRGKLIRNLLSTQKQAGWHEISWNGKDDRGNDLSAGKYIYRLKSNGIIHTKTLIYIN
jgi:flagellar hook assembly protein FlgD